MRLIWISNQTVSLRYGWLESDYSLIWVLNVVGLSLRCEWVESQMYAGSKSLRYSLCDLRCSWVECQTWFFESQVWLIWISGAVDLNFKRLMVWVSDMVGLNAIRSVWVLLNVLGFNLRCGWIKSQLWLVWVSVTLIFRYWLESLQFDYNNFESRLCYFLFLYCATKLTLYFV